MTAHDEMIKRRAHALWEAAGEPHGQDVKFWLQAEQELAAAGSDTDDAENEGEGNRTAARKYNADTKKFIEGDHVEQSAHDAAAALDDPAQRKVLAEAEAAGKAHSHGEDPTLHAQAAKGKR